MTISVEVEQLDAVRRRLSVVVPASRLTAGFQKALDDVARSASLPGFRRGRVPRPILERTLGEGVHARVVDDLLRESFVEAVNDRGLQVVGTPHFETEAAALGGDLRYQATVEVRPEVTATSYRGLAVKRQRTAISEAMVEDILQRMRESRAQLTPVVDRTAVGEGDVVTLSYDASIGGKPAGRAERVDVDPARNGFPAGFSDRLLGVEVGGRSEFSLPLGEGETAPQVEFAVEVHAIAHKELLPLDDDFARSVGDADTLEELRSRIRASLGADEEAHASRRMRHQLTEALVAANPFELPPSMVDRYAESLAEEAWEEMRRSRTRPRNEAEMRRRLRTDAEPRARHEISLLFLLESVATQENLTVSDEELTARVEEMAERSGPDADRVRAAYGDGERRDNLQGSLRREKALDFVVSHAAIEDEWLDPEAPDQGPA